jgi:rod shape-determining protein MreC
MAVVTPAGVVGKVWEVFPGTAEILLLTDDRSGVGVLLADSRAQGVVKGTGDSAPALSYISPDETVQSGTEVLTSGEDQIYPKDFPVGVVAEVKPPAKGSPFQQISIRPSARLDRLEEVIVLLTRQDLNLRAGEPAPGQKPASPLKSAPAQAGPRQ